MSLVRTFLVWCGCLLALALPCAARDTKTPPTTLDLRVASYNAWLMPFFSKAYEERRKKLPGALRGLKADVLCLQEVWSGADQGTLASTLAKDLPHAHRCVGGLLLLSKYEIASATFTRFPEDEALPMRERIAGKGWLDATLKTSIGAVRVVTSHLAAMPHADSPRSRQLTALLTHLDKDKQAPTILAADLNMPALRNGQPGVDWRRLGTHGFVDLNAPTRKADGTWRDGALTWYRWPRTNTRGYRRDYLCLRSSERIRVEVRTFRQALDDAETALSDHNAQVADLRLRVVTPKPKRAAR